ncbi:MAG: permease-like cell division protein FtsX [Elusimicrobiota bacterium]|jgi:cell division transport system permease protein|nr:permease-like cell division protein FtsX [Elusimicrobiota bacterium]
MLNQVFLNIKRYNSVSFDMIILITLFLFILGCIFMVKLNFENFSEKIKNKLEIALILKNDVKINDENQETFINQILDNEKNKLIETINFIKKEEALEKFISENTNLKEQIDILDENPLKDYFLIKLKNNDYLNIKNFVESIQDLEFIDDIVYSEELIKNVDIFLDYITKILIIVAIFFIIIMAWLFVYNIKISVQYKKVEFLLWNYFGVKKTIKNFLVFGEGFILGCISGILGNLFLLLLHICLSKFLFNLEFLNKFYIFSILTIGICLSIIVNFIVFKKSKNEALQF